MTGKGFESLVSKVESSQSDSLSRYEHQLIKISVIHQEFQPHPAYTLKTIC